MKKRILAMLMTLVMLLSLCPAAAVAEEEGSIAPAAAEDPAEDGGVIHPEETEALAEQPAADGTLDASASGECGPNLSWTLDDGVLTISGTGEMNDYSWEGGPWRSAGVIRSVVIEPGVTSIGNYAFSNCYQMQSVSIPEGITRIGDCAFLSCASLTEIRLPSSLAELGTMPFPYCSALTAFEVAEGSASFSARDGMLYNADGTELLFCPGAYAGSYAIPDGVRRIGSHAFYDCEAVTDISIPASVTNIGYWAFMSCSSLERIQVAEDNPAYCTVDDVLYSKALTELIRCPAAKGGVLSIPSGVETVDFQSCSGCRNLTQVLFPDSVRTIDIEAFFQCSALTEIILPTDLEVLGERAFADCSAVSQIRFQSAAPEIGEDAFRGVTATAYYPKGDESWTADVMQNYEGSLTWVEGPATLHITVQPVPQLAKPGELVSFSVTASGENLRYQWYSRSGAEAAWTILEGEESASCSLTADSSLDGYEFYCRITDDSKTVSTRTVKLRVTDRDHIAGGVCGENVIWLLQEDGTFILSGTGEIREEDFSWTDRAGQILHVVVEPGITALGGYSMAGGAFQNCIHLTEVELPEGLLWLGGRCFQDCDSLREITLPASLESVEQGALSDCDNLERILVAEGNETFCSVDGILFSKDRETLYVYPAGLGGSYTVPENVKTLEWRAFWGCRKLTSVTLPDTLSDLGANTFQNCVSLERVNIPNCVNTLPMSCFYGCSALEEITIPASVSNIVGYTFLDCTALKTVRFLGRAPDLDYETVFTGLTLTAYYPAGDSSWNSSVFEAMGGNVTWLEFAGFGACGDDLTWTLYTDGSLVISGTGPMWNYADPNTRNTASPWSRSEELKALSLQSGVSSVGEYAFTDCDSLRSVELPDTIETIGAGAFRDCDGLEIVEYNGNQAQWAQVNVAAGNDALLAAELRVQTADPSACGDSLTWSVSDGVLTISGTGDMWDYTDSDSPWKQENVTSVVLEEGVTGVGARAFSYIRTITDVTLPSTLQRIGEEAFYGCSPKAITLPGTVTSIGRRALCFAYDPSASYIVNYMGTMAQWREAGGSRVIMPYTTAVHCTDGIIGQASSNQCGDNLTWSLENGVLTVTGTGEMWEQPIWLMDSSFTTVILEEGVTSIGKDAFSYCGNLSSVRLPNTLQLIENGAFTGCSALKSITLPASLEVLQRWALAGCGLTEIYFRGSAPEIGAYCFNGLTATVYYPQDDPSWTEEIRQDYMGTITWVPYDAPESEILASGECGDDLTWTLDDRGTLTVSGTGPMWDTDADVEFWQSYSSQISAVVVEEGATSLRDSAFYSCEGLKSVSLPDSLETIGYFAFGGCSKLEEILLPKGVKTVGCNTFWGCSALKEIRVAEDNPWLCSVEGVLYDKSMTTLITCPEAKNGEPVLPDSLTAIGDEAFGFCQIETITIPALVTSIGMDAFSGCDRLKEIHFMGSAPVIGASAFTRVTATVFYPENDASWTEEVRQDYGGTLTWHEGEYAVLGSGQCGDNAFWSMCEDGTLTISGTGAMWDYGPMPEDLPVWLRDHSSQIKVIRIEEGITHVGANTFKTGYYSVSAESIELPESLLSVGDYAFWQSSCASVKLPQGLQVIGEEAFGLAAISGELQIPGSVERIDKGAFWETSINTLIVEPGVREIGIEAFAYCRNLTIVGVPGSVTAIGKQAFAKGCENLRDIYFTGTKAQWAQIGGQYAIEHYITTVHCTDGDILPATMDRCGDDLTWSLENGVLTVTGTGDMWDFSYGLQPWYSSRSQIRSVVLSEGVTSVGCEAFSGSYLAQFQILELSFPDSLKEIGDSAFQYCKSLSSVSIPSGVESIGMNAFFSCNQLTELTLGEGLRRIGDSAFSGCGIASATLPKHLESLGSGAFASCMSLTEITFMGSAPSIEAYAFARVTATAYYPENDETWTEEVRQDYGGTITWEAVAPAYVPGDINGDGGLDNKDVTRLIRYIKYHDVEANEAALDVNGDGVLDNKDVTRLIRYIKYHDVEIF